MYILLLILGAVGGFLSGLLGIGGAIIMIPLMLYIPPALAVGQLDAQVVSGLSMVQVFFSSLSGLFQHWKYNFIDGRLLAAMGAGMLAGSSAGSILSKNFSGMEITIAFGLLAVSAAILMLFPAPIQKAAPDGENHLKFNPYLASFLALLVGTLSGIVGAGGGFILIPIMIYILKIPIKNAIGTSLAVVFVGAVSGTLGKGLTGQIQWEFAIPLILGAIPFARLGSTASKKLPPHVLRYCLLAVILLTCVQVWGNILKY